MPEDAVRVEAVSALKFPLIREITGNFVETDALLTLCRGQKSPSSGRLFRNSLWDRTGNFFVVNRDI